MSSATAPPSPPVARRKPPVRRVHSSSSLLAHGTPLVWLYGGAVAVCLCMIVGLLVLVFYQGLSAFWPVPLVEIQTVDGRIYLGEVTREETYRPDPAVLEKLPEQVRAEALAKLDQHGGAAVRRLLRTGNFELTHTHYTWVSDFEIAQETRPEWGVVIERATNDGRFYGFPTAFLLDGQAATTEPTEILAKFDEYHTASLDAAKEKYALQLTTASKEKKVLALADIVRLYPANQLSFSGKMSIYLSRWWEFLSANPRNANSEGGVFPAIWGTAAMTILMSLAVVPFGVMAALYLREYAKGGLLISTIRVAVNNLAGVPSIVYGVFGLAFFCYFVGGSVDRLLFAERLPNPTYGTGGILWASLTLALLTLPVVIVATEESLAAVPRSMREGSFACGASKWQTIWRVVLPRSMPGILTGMVLAMARGAGEVAPLMLVGAVKQAPLLPLDRVFPFVHPDRSFMHLGFHIYDVGFQSQDSESAKPMVYTTTMLLILLITTLNLAAMWLRSRLRKKYATGAF